MKEYFVLSSYGNLTQATASDNGICALCVCVKVIGIQIAYM
jgi:hypothetical protein